MDDRYMPDAPEERAQVGLFDSLKALLATLLGIAHTRVELISTEVEEQFARLVSLLVWGLVALFFAFTGVILSAIAVVVVFWDSNRLLAAGLLGGLFIAIGTGAALIARRRLRERPKLLAATLAELERDRETLGQP